MKLLAIISECGPRNVEEDRPVAYKLREAARAILSDDQGRVAVLAVTKRNYYKLPGGGLEGNEGVLAALKRELREETGCYASIDKSPVGAVIEIRRQIKLFHISYCFRARVVGTPRVTKFTAEELSLGFKLIWVKPAKALKLLNLSRPRDYAGRFIVKRDLTLLKAALTK